MCNKRDCGSANLVFEDGVVGTKPFPSIFPPLTDCTITVSAGDDKYIAVQFVDYEVRFVPFKESFTIVSEISRISILLIF